MATYKRWEKDSCGVGGQYVNYEYPDSYDNDCFFILAPLVSIFKLVFKGVLSLPGVLILIGIPIGLCVAAIGIICFLAFILLVFLFGPMLENWKTIAESFFEDVGSFFVWSFKKMFKRQELTYTQS